MEFRYFFTSILILSCLSPSVKSSDADALLSLKSSIDPSGLLPWRGTNACQWQGVKECLRGRVTKLVVEYRNLNGSLEEKSLNQLDQLRVLSFKGNSIFGAIPNISGLVNLKSLFLNDNQFTGRFPSAISGLHRLKVVVLSDNQLTGEIPESIVRLRRLYVLQLQNNGFTGKIPPLNQTSLRYFNVSNNTLSGEIPTTPAFVRFNSSSFSNNPNLCGELIRKPCVKGLNPSSSPSSSSAQSPTAEQRNHPKKSKKKLTVIVAASIAGFFFLLICLVVLWRLCCRGSRDRSRDKEVRPGKVEEEGGEGPSSGLDGNNAGGKGGFSWDGEGLGSLVFCGGAEQMYTLEDLLKASAETLGRGTMGSTYKAVMESGFIVTVKRLKDSTYPRLEEFCRQMDVLGRLRHPNLVPLWAYFQAKEERLLVYDYFPNGSLFSLIHGSRPSGGGKPLHWTSCLKIAEDLATGLVYLHETAGIVHGNLKSSNVLLGSDFESCITDYGLTPFRSPDSLEDSSGGGNGASSLFYRAPECRQPRKPFTLQSDVYSFGVLLLEVLTGKTPFQDLVLEHGADIPNWVRSVREEETESGDEPSSGNEASEEKLAALLNIAMACVASVAENRPAMKDVLRMIKEARAEAQVSSNSSDHSPGRWSDTVQSLPREYGTEHLNFTERD